MGNQTSQTSTEFQKQFQNLQDQLKNQYRRQTIDLHRLQQQIYHTQLKLHELKTQPVSHNNNYNQHGYNNINSNSMQNILANPDLKKEMITNPAFGVQIIELILNEFGTQLTDQQHEKINGYLERVTQQTSEQQKHQQISQMNHHNNHSNSNNKIISHPTQNMSINDRYLSEEEAATRKFEEEQKRQRREFEEQQRRRREEYQKQLSDFESTQINPYKLLGVNQNYTLDQLKTAYRKKAIVCHPDKGGSAKLFDEVTKAYFSLLEKLKMKEQDKQYMDLKNGSREYLDKQQSENRQNIGLKAEKGFNLNAFNKIFEENRINDPTDTGYDDWLKKDNKKEPPKVFSTKFNIDNFNTMFENWKDEDEELGREIVLSEGPRALMAYHGKTGFTELGVDKIDDFTKADPNSRNLGYTDLKQAYSRNGLINARSANVRESYKNVEEYERARTARTSYQMTPEELRKEEIQKFKEKEEEERRIQRVQNRDSQTFNSYNRVHQMMIDKLK
jgi:curved DNA-binding protein CbpA